MGELETVEFNRDQGFGITVYLGTRKGSASTSDSSPEAVRDTVRAALNIARFTQEDPCHGLAAADLMPEVLPDLDLYHPWGVSVADAERAALACEEVARDDARVVNSDGASVSTHQSCRVYGNTHGFIGSYLSTRHSTSCSVIAGEQDRMQRDYWYTVARRAEALEAPELVGRKAAERTLARLDPGKIATGRYPVLFDATVASGLVGHLLNALSGSALYRRSSFLTPIHSSVRCSLMATRWSSIPCVPVAMVARHFDADGVATREQAFVDAGRVASYVLGTYSARRLGLETTGNAGGVHNLDFEGPKRTRQELLAEMGRGLLVTELMGQGINLVTGDYSRGGCGILGRKRRDSLPGARVDHRLESCTDVSGYRRLRR